MSDDRTLVWILAPIIGGVIGLVTAAGQRGGAQEVGRAATFVLGALGLLVLFALGIAFCPPLSLTEVVLLLILMELRGQQKEPSK